MLSISYVWPIALVVLSNVFYQICTKSVPDGLDPFAALTVTYAVGAVFSAVLFKVLNHHGSLLREYGKVNWTSFVLGLVIVGLEVGFIYAYKAGWPVSTASVVQSSFLAAALLVVGLVLYKEPITVTKVVGLVICLVGLFFLNKG